MRLFLFSAKRNALHAKITFTSKHLPSRDLYFFFQNNPLSLISDAILMMKTVDLRFANELSFCGH